MKHLILLLFPISVFGQSISNSVINSTGSFSEAGGFSLTQSFGEVTVETLTASNIIVTQGFLQPLHTDGYIVDTEEQTSSNFKIYPNPVQDYIVLDGDISKIENIIITNTIGQIVKQENLIQKTIDLSTIVKGTYILKIQFKENIATQSYQIIKL